MSFLTSSSPCEPSYFFPHAHPAPLPVVSEPTHAPAPAPSIPLPPRTAIDLLRTPLRSLSDLVDLVKRNIGTSIALAGIAAVIEDPQCLPQLSELGGGLMGVACAGGVILSVVALENAGDGWDMGVEGAWGKVWRWVQDRIAGQEGSEGGVGEEVEVEVTMMFNEDGESVFLLDEPQQARPTTLLPESNTGSRRETPLHSREKPARPALPAFKSPTAPDTRPLNSPPSPVHSKHAYTSSSSQPRLHHPVPRPRPGHDASRHLDENHTSGLLGPSPMPPRRTAPKEFDFKHFTGQGFHKHEQRLKAVNQWLAPGRIDRSFDEILVDIEETEDAGRY